MTTFTIIDCSIKLLLLICDNIRMISLISIGRVLVSAVCRNDESFIYNLNTAVDFRGSKDRRH